MFVDSRGSALIRHQIKRFFQCVITAWHVNASSVVCTLIDNGKLANQIATLLPTVVKQYIDTDWHLLWVEFHSDILKTNSLCTWVSANRKHHLMSKTNKIFISHWLVLQWFPYYDWPRKLTQPSKIIKSNTKTSHEQSLALSRPQAAFLFSTLWVLIGHLTVIVSSVLTGWCGLVTRVFPRFKHLICFCFSTYWLLAIFSFVLIGHSD